MIANMSVKTGYVYDDRMTLHQNAKKPDHVENSARITVPFQMLKESGALEDCVNIPSRLATDDELSLVHTAKYIEQLKQYGSLPAESMENPCKIEEKWPSYISNDVFISSSVAVGCALQLTDAVCTNKVKNGVAVVRPPGHHAEVDESCGFCFFNNVAIATRYAQKKHGLKRVLIVDWDIHFGNGIHNIFSDDPSVLYISLHRYDNGDYFPGLTEGCIESVGKNQGEGFSINVAWNKDIMGDSEYKRAFDSIVMPAANQFNPDLIIVAAGFDAVVSDPLGDYVLTTDMYAYMTQKLLRIGTGRVILMLEGGYNAHAIGDCLVACTRVLMGDKDQRINLDIKEPCRRALQTIQRVIQCHSKYWKLKD
ncbi:hypothetical protein CAPTEDRAFT_173494 [Capitella teleta]|uniref:histone deacetylase n=1 Tax=Capitella teleta TaxID=283909 RepID=R7U6B1_CAPTE|nr:hypothetical protein CAPTEDRAFT_173494 [Capitella teleta]|eukprot:ELU01509.1 hypothetical protein CAPTEDRAFT_173494 [Capitella teleta]